MFGDDNRTLEDLPLDELVLWFRREVERRDEVVAADIFVQKEGPDQYTRQYGLDHPMHMTFLSLVREIRNNLWEKLSIMFKYVKNVLYDAGRKDTVRYILVDDSTLEWINNLAEERSGE